ncbi:probable microtubule-binding protein TANGLED isoform X1 [Gossypium hirsutum]|uniref:Probable microtubule-binding protein TANGLED isoform X1 n=1 Tax=Gossypium hirsutum TaxID=3635 RepID=A0A1U8IRY2_GOSHI|nr:probable microtubule-binding protein TANGLED isoform X1 [Gossypium hirsutum]XP_016678674.1 probable microtubule-binding protein TANGLED isoform X1 [Gossypium hirsutum]XP_016678675.1 probable microtubule-binding protein TANGLED isoform X1 [Gossypium hirsutum]XP_040951448.1 probable microtubule-binding protein TANGLED isoform X1 [Gossypium hirsutum]
MRTTLKCKQESLRMKNSTPRKSPVGKFPATVGGECRRMSLPAMLVGETVGEILQANQFAIQILAIVDNKTKNTSEDPKTPLTEHRKQIYQFLKSLMEKDDSKCRQNAVVERKTVLVPKSETIVHAIVTNVKTFDYQLSNGDMKPIKEGLNGLKTTRKQRSKGRK